MDTNDPTTSVTTELARKQIPFRLFSHPGPVRSLEQAARERGQRPDQIVRSILFRASQENYTLVLVAGPRRLSWRALRSHLGLTRLTMAQPEEVLSVTGYELGAVSPFGLPLPIRTLVDESVTALQGEVSIGSGRRGLAVILRAEDLLRALGKVEMGNFCQEP